MLTRQLGRTALQVTPLCLGGNVFGWTCDEPTSFEVLNAYVAGGGNFIDTADSYSAWQPGNTGGESETIIGRWMKSRGNRQHVIIATKVGSRMYTGPNMQGLSQRYILEEVEASLKRLQTDYIDLYQAHRDDPQTPLSETMAAFDALVRQGKVRYVGASNYTAERLREAIQVSAQHGYVRYESLQPPYSLLNRADYERDLEALCLQEGLGVITYSSLASGFLTGKYRAGKEVPATPRAQGIQEHYMNERGFAILKQVEQVAKAHNATIAQVALAWILTRPSITAPIASATSVEQTQELLGSVSLQLTADEIASLNEVSDWRQER